MSAVKELGSTPVNPVECSWYGDGSFKGVQTGNATGYATGITLRQHFAGLAMQAFVASFKHGYEALNVDGVAKISLMQADALLAELSKETP